MMHKTILRQMLTRILAVGLIALNIACTDKGKQTKRKEEVLKQEKTALNYDLTQPEKFTVPDRLFEISGIAFNQGDPKTVYAIQDEDGLLFSLALGDKVAKTSKFAGKGDYEDLSIIKNQVVVLKSNGTLYTFSIAEAGQDKAVSVQEFKKLVPKAEYEGLFADEETGLVYVLTKQSADTKQTPIFILNIDDKGVLTGNSQINLLHKDIEAFTKTGKIKFKPSALAKNPITKEWYILSSVNKLLLVLDASFKLKTASALDAGIFNQPEGMAFDKEQNLYISNEGGNLDAGNILRFNPKNK